MTKNEIVYICSPLNAPTREGINTNMKQAKIYMRKASCYFACRAIAPHAYLPMFVDDNNPTERQLSLEFGLGFLKLSSAIIVCGSRLSPGMKGEISSAYAMGKQIYAGSVTVKQMIINHLNISNETQIKVVTVFA